MTEPVRIGDCELYLGDCMSILPTLGKVDAVVTDPPYGIGQDGGKLRRPIGRKRVRMLPKMGWDLEPPPAEAFGLILDAAPHQIIWGGNYFADKLPVSRGWLYWDKMMGGDFSDGELAWTSLDMALRSFRLCNKTHGKEHPTQKPVKLIEWCLGFLPNAHTILDPYAGSGTTAVACVKRGLSFVGIEREPRYFDIACKRIEDAYKQGDLFIEKPKPAEQMGLLP